MGEYIVQARRRVQQGKARIFPRWQLTRRIGSDGLFPERERKLAVSWLRPSLGVSYASFSGGYSERGAC